MALVLALDLRPDLALAILDAVPTLLQVSRAVRDLLSAMLGTLRHLRVPAADVSFLLAEVLAKWATNLETLTIGDSGLVCEVLGLDVQPWLSTSFMTSVEAIMMAPFLRRNHAFQGFCRRQCNPPRYTMRLKLQNLQRPRGRLVWQHLGDDAPDSVESIFMLSLVGRDTRKRFCWRRAASIEWNTHEPCRDVRRAMRVASRRTGVDIFPTRGLPPKLQRKEDVSGFLICLICTVVLGMLWLRWSEDAYARETGFPGALTSSHPLKMLTFSERLQSGELLTDGRTEM